MNVRTTVWTCMCLRHRSLQHGEVCTALLDPESLFSAAAHLRTRDRDLPDTKGRASSHTEKPRRCSSSIAMNAVVTDGSSMLPLRMTSLKLAILMRCICRQTFDILRTAHRSLHRHCTMSCLLFQPTEAENKTTNEMS